MDLFSGQTSEEYNLLPYDGQVNYYGIALNKEAADRYYRNLLEHIKWEHDIAIMFGKRIVTKRKVAWYGDRPFEYTYSNNTKEALPWNQELRELKKIAENQTGTTYNSCLLNLYHTGEEGMAWHSDDEKDLLPNGAIASMSFGAQRKFAFKHKSTKETVSVVLDHGSLLVMTGTTQTHWHHRLPPTKKVKAARVNLTFRTIVD